MSQSDPKQAILRRMACGQRLVGPGQAGQEGSERPDHQSAKARNQPIIGMQRAQLQEARKQRHLHEEERGTDGGHQGDDRSAGLEAG